jgi:hypothetical protein
MSLNLDMDVRVVALDSNATPPETEADAKIGRSWIKDLIALIGTCVGVVLISAAVVLLYLA